MSPTTALIVGYIAGAASLIIGIAFGSAAHEGDVRAELELERLKREHDDELYYMFAEPRGRN